MLSGSSGDGQIVVEIAPSGAVNNNYESLWTRFEGTMFSASGATGPVDAILVGQNSWAQFSGLTTIFNFPSGGTPITQGSNTKVSFDELDISGAGLVAFRYRRGNATQFAEVPTSALYPFLPNNGEFATNSTTGDLYCRIAGTWVKVSP